MDKNLSALEKNLGRFSVLDKLPENLLVPAEWQPLIGRSDKEKVKHITSLWDKYYHTEFSALLGIFQKRLNTVHLIELENKPALLYIFKNPQGEYLHYVGHAPLLSGQLPATTENLPWPAKFLEFYKTIHNGWYEVESHALGLFPIDEFFWLSEQEWGVLDEIEIDFSLDKVLAVFSNSAGGYLCWNFNTTEPSGLVWWDDEEPDMADFWDILDEWSAMGIEEY
ncbi:SMI1/KNR4 family protein [Hymenobacter psychrotolerans]|uniref:SMI1 / KNR4 family (SUKH-1) n=1 Tax=Hymenobacter psychrotolerans DSM 18569 TaxID=1121959 RepID=A0A1M7FGY1_9BACT|nr:SMI1/KNR4 family protein [Hymenobacter psychrotolerans]SHM03362.1 hypothetical protein SAMN02746009_03840 [Hymenobacter psychrotolerans DSM 18569]